MKSSVCAAVLAWASLAGAAYAQTPGPLTPNDPTQALPPPPVSPPLDPGAPAEPPTPAPADAQAFVLNEVRFRNASALTTERLAQSWEAYRGKPVSLPELRKIAANVEDAYAEAGFPFVAVVVPPQEIREGIVELEVVEGRVSDLTVLGLDPIARRQATTAFAHLIDKRPLPLAEVEASYERARAVPGLTMAGSLRRGTVPGGMDLVIQAQRNPSRFYVNTNNFYPEAVGPWGVLAGLEWNGASRYGDQTSLQAYTTYEWGEQWVVRASHVRRLNARGLTLSLSALTAEAEPEGDASILDLATNVLAGQVELSYPVIALPRLHVNAAVSFDYTDQETLLFDDFGLTEDRVRVLAARVFGDWRRDDLTLRYELEARKGLDLFDASQPGNPDSSRLESDPQGFVLRGGVAGEKPVGFIRGRIGFRGEAQWSPDSLTTVEEYTIGNLTVGRGYDPGATFGDRAIAFSVEGRWGPIATQRKVNIEPFVFFDAAEVWNEEEFAPDGEWIASVGGGLRFTVADNVRLDVTYAVPLEEPLGVLGFGSGTPDPRLLINLTATLSDVAGFLREGPRRRTAR